MKKFYFVVLAIFLTSCVTAKTTGFVDPKYKDGGYKISKVVVQIEQATLEETQIAEQKLVEKFNAYNVAAIKFTDIAPPTRTYTPAQKAKLLKKSGADSVFTIYAGKSAVKSYVPPMYHSGTTSSSVNTIGNITHVTTHTTPGYTTGGYSVSLPTMACLSRLIDLRNGNQIWKAEGTAGGDAFSSSSYSDLLVGIGISAIKDLEEKGLLPQPKS